MNPIHYSYHCYVKFSSVAKIKGDAKQNIANSIKAGIEKIARVKKDDADIVITPSMDDGDEAALIALTWGKQLVVEIYKDRCSAESEFNSDGQADKGLVVDAILAIFEVDIFKSSKVESYIFGSVGYADSEDRMLIEKAKKYYLSSSLQDITDFRVSTDKNAIFMDRQVTERVSVASVVDPETEVDALRLGHHYYYDSEDEGNAILDQKSLAAQMNIIRENDYLQLTLDAIDAGE